MMKKYVINAISLMLILSMLFVRISADNDIKTDNSVDGINIIASTIENSKYKLVFDNEKANIYIIDKTNNFTVYSSPNQICEDNGRINSQIVVYYYDDKKLKSLDSYNNGVKLKNKTDCKIKNNKMSVTYSIGNSDTFVSDMLPMVLTKERMENDILSHLTSDEKEKVLSRYTLYSRKKLDKKTLDTIQLNFSTITSNDLYIRSNLPDYIAKDIYDLFLKVGYTTDDLKRDCQENNVENKYKESPFFKVEVVYSLSDDGFSASVNPKNIESKKEYKPYRIEIIPYFGALDSTHNGYMFVPDSSGAIINCNNQKQTVPIYWKRLFNNDYSLKSEQIEYNSKPSVLPLYALIGDDYGFFATIDEGYENCGIFAGVSGKESNYNNVSAFFDLYSADYVSLSSSGYDTFVLMNDNIFSSNIKITFHLINGKTDYSSLALKYREYLIKEKLLNENFQNSSDIDLDFITSAYVTKKFLGIEYQKLSSLTNFKQSVEILKNFPNEKIKVSLINALDGGIKQKSAVNINTLSVLGNKNDLKNLKDNCNELQINLSSSYKNNIKKSNASMTLNREKSKKYDINILSRCKENNSFNYILSPKIFEKNAVTLSKNIKNSNFSSVGINDIGFELNSDFNRQKKYDRHFSRLKTEEYFKKIKETSKVSADIGSIYSLKYLDEINNLPCNSSGYLIEDYSVPFYQIVISGSVPFTLDSINQSYNPTRQFLKSVEYGAKLHYTFVYELKDNITNNNEKYYDCIYKNYISSAKAQASLYLPLYKKICGKKIVNHTMVLNDLSKTTYENGVCVYVNFSDKNIKFNGLNIKSESFESTTE